MADEAEAKMVVEYALDNSQRLKAALAIYDAYHEIRRPVIKNFVSDLKEAVTNALNASRREWVVEVRPDDWWWQRNCELSVRHQEWKNGQRIGISAGMYGPNDLWFGVWGIADAEMAASTFKQLNHRVAVGWPVLDSNPPLQCATILGIYLMVDGNWVIGGAPLLFSPCMKAKKVITISGFATRS